MNTGFQFDPTTYGPSIAPLLIPERLPELGPGSPNLATKPVLQSLKTSPLCLAGLWLYHDFLDESHTISQGLDTKEGSFWHAIMHRREPDPSNSKYWWRMVGAHPVIEQLQAESPALGYTYISPFAFVDFCERVRGSGTKEEGLARSIQRLEWQLLFDHCYRLSP
jgi:hypothetical protein